MTKDDSRIVKDPICGKEVDTLRARAVGIFGGVTYYFCSAECKAKYQDPRHTPRANPEPAPWAAPAAPAKVLVATDSPKRKAEKAAEKARAEKAEQSAQIPKIAKGDKSGRVPKVEPAVVAAKAEAKGEPSHRVVDFVAEPSSHFEQAEELTPIPAPRRRFPLLALLLLALLVAGGVVLFTLKHK